MKLSDYNVWVEDPGVPPAVYNGISGDLILLEPGEIAAVRDFVTTGDPGGLAPARAEQLVRSRVLVSDELDELKVLDARYKKAKHDAGQLGLTLVTSLGCNFDCPYCYESKHPSIMSGEVQEAILQLVDDGAGRLHGLDVTWMGGEPLVGKRSLLELSDAMIDRCDRHGITYSAIIITNGWHLDGHVSKELADRKVSFAQVTLDGPPEVHDVMRPQVGGGPTFWRIVENLHAAIEHLDVAIRVNVDESNLWRAEELMQILADEGLSGKLQVISAKMTYYGDNEAAPLTSYETRCYTSPEFAKVRLDFEELAYRYGFGGPSGPEPVHVPCMAVANNAIVVGADGEVWKCWDDIGNPDKTVGDIRNYRELDEQAILPWLLFNPTEDPQCSSCIALPSCMGGCLHHTLAGHPRDAQCGSFRFNYQEQIRRTVLQRTGNPHRSVVLETVAASRLAAELSAQERQWQPVELRVGHRSSAFT